MTTLVWSGFALLVALGLAPSPTLAQEEEKNEINIVEPILTEETLPNEPRELSLRLTTDYRKKDSEAMAVLPRVDVFYGLVERVGVELSVPMAYHKEEGGRAYGLGTFPSV
jgi:hypothetical protein